MSSERPGAALRRGLAAVLVAVAATVPPTTAASGERWALSRSTYGQVGRLDHRLSAACRRMTFNQHRDHRLYIGFNGERGRGTTGIARKGWNLRDPLDLGEPGVTYHFKDDGFSTCRVYVARGRGRR